MATTNNVLFSTRLRVDRTLGLGIASARKGALCILKYRKHPMRNPIFRLRAQTMFTRPRPWMRVAGALVFTVGCLSAQAGEPRGATDDWGMHAFGIENCLGTLAHEGNEFTAATDCAIDQVFSRFADVAFLYIEEHGKARFGEHFHIDRRLGLVASTGTLSADLDVVIPLNAFSSVEDDKVTRSFFVQNGVTRWRDEHGFQRNDVRVGAVHRYALGERLQGGIFGTSMFVQENLERGHARMVTRLEYFGKWGQSSLNHYLPLTDWRPGRHGHEERAIAGVELGYFTSLTSTVDFRAAAGRWESKDGSDMWTTRGPSRYRMATASMAQATRGLGQDRHSGRFHGDARVVDDAPGRRRQGACALGRTRSRRFSVSGARSVGDVELCGPCRKNRGRRARDA